MKNNYNELTNELIIAISISIGRDAVITKSNGLWKLGPRVSSQYFENLLLQENAIEIISDFINVYFAEKFIETHYTAEEYAGSINIIGIASMVEGPIIRGSVNEASWEFVKPYLTDKHHQWQNLAEYLYKLPQANQEKGIAVLEYIAEKYEHLREKIYALIISNCSDYRETYSPLDQKIAQAIQTNALLQQKAEELYNYSTEENKNYVVDNLNYQPMVIRSVLSTVKVDGISDITQTLLHNCHTDLTPEQNIIFAQKLDKIIKAITTNEEINFIFSKMGGVTSLNITKEIDLRAGYDGEYGNNIVTLYHVLDYLSGNDTKDNEFANTITHEYLHGIVAKVFENESLPFKKENAEEEARWKKVAIKCRSEIENIKAPAGTRGEEIDNAKYLLDYGMDWWPAELPAYYMGEVAQRMITPSTQDSYLLSQEWLGGKMKNLFSGMREYFDAQPSVIEATAEATLTGLDDVAVYSDLG